MTDALVERVADVLLELHAENRHVKAQAIVEALGGERVWFAESPYMDFWACSSEPLEIDELLAEAELPGRAAPALLIPLGESDVAE